MRNINASVVGLGSGLLLATVSALWKAAGFRSNVIKEFQSRVALAQAGLDERAAEALRKLADRVNEVLGALDEFDPNQALADPRDLQAYVATAQRYLKARRRLPIYFRGLLRVGPILVVLLTLLIVGWLVTFAYFSGWSRNRTMGYVALWASLAVVGAVGLVTVYCIVCQQRFSGAEILSMGTNERD